MFKTLTCCIIRTVTEVCNTAWNHGAGGPQNLENSEAKSLNQCGKSMRPSNFWGMRGCYGWGAFFLFFDFFGANFSPFSCELVVHMRPGRQQGSKIWMLSKSLIPRFFSKQFWSKSIFWFRKVTTKQNLIEFDFCVPTNRGTKVSKIWNGSNSQVSKFPQQKDDGMAEVEVWQFFFSSEWINWFGPEVPPSLDVEEASIFVALLGQRGDSAVVKHCMWGLYQKRHGVGKWLE